MASRDTDLLGDCLSIQKRYAEAEPFLLTGYDEMKTGPGERDLKSEAARRLHDFYLTWNKPADAVRFAGLTADSPASTPSR